MNVHIKLGLLFKNSHPSPCIVEHDNSKFLLPPRTELMVSDVRNLDSLINDCKVNGKFDIIVLDPPWENKSVKRGNKYTWLSFNDISKMPLRDLASESCLFLVWVTNNLKTMQFVRDILFSSNDATSISTWYWVKLTTTLEPIFPFDSPHKRPYETVLLGCNCVHYGHTCKHTGIPERFNIFSVPCSIHSFKPPLHNVLKHFLKTFKDLKCLEMFARNLLPGWTSWGNEVVKHQNLNYFEILYINNVHQ